MKYFCSKCGKTTLYNLELPKFCSYCGKSFSSILNNNELKLNKNINSSNIEKDILPNSESFDSNDEFNEHQISNFKKIKPSFKLDIYKAKNETFGSLVENPHKPIDSTYINNEIKTPEQVLQEFQKEAGLSRIEE